MLWLGTPCASWSRARHDVQGHGPRTRQHIWGVPDLSAADVERVENGNAFARFSATAIDAADRAGTITVLEHPYNSLLWMCPPIARLCPSGHSVVLDYFQLEPHGVNERDFRSGTVVIHLGPSCAPHGGPAQKQGDNTKSSQESTQNQNGPGQKSPSHTPPQFVFLLVGSSRSQRRLQESCPQVRASRCLILPAGVGLQLGGGQWPAVLNVRRTLVAAPCAPPSRRPVGPRGADLFPMKPSLMSSSPSSETEPCATR